MGSVALHGFGGGGTSLNFKVVGNPQPTNPKENTIWLNTDVDITGCSFRAERPEGMAEGEVWISTGTESQVAFNALKKSTIMVYPLAAKQMQGGTLVDVTAKSWQDSEWVDWAFYVFLPDGEHVTGWTQATLNGGGYSFDGEGHLVLTKAAGNGNVGTGTVLLSPVYGLSQRNTLKVRMKASNTSSGDGIFIGIRSSVVSDYWSANNAQWIVKTECSKTTDFTEFLCDISQVSSGCIAIEINGTAAAKFTTNITIESIVLI